QDVMYFQFPYFLFGTKCAGVGIISILLIVFAFVRRSVRFITPLISLMISLVFLIEVPSLKPESQMLREESRPLDSAREALATFYQEHGRYPSDESELRGALRIPVGTPSIFARRGSPIPFRVQMMKGSPSDFLHRLPDSPGVLMYAVSSDLSQYWLAVTSLA